MSGYWERRASARMDRYLRDSQQTVDTVSRAYQRALRDIQDDLERIFDRFMRDNNLTRDEARAFLSQAVDQSEYEQLLQDISTVRDPEVRRLMQARANAPAYRYRMTRAQAMAERIHVRMGQVADVEITADTDSFRRTIEDAYGRSMFDIQRGTGYGFSFADLTTGQVQEILRNPWSGETFSKRVWNNTQALADQLNETITAGFLSGRSIYDMADDLEHLTNGGRHAAMRVIRTETNYMANAAEMESYRAAGIEKYEYMATLDNKTSEKCQELDGQVFNVDDAKPGVNMPPAHAHCRSTTVARFDDDVLAGMERTARDPVTGKPITVPRDMTYKEWHKKYVVPSRSMGTLAKGTGSVTGGGGGFQKYLQTAGVDLLDESFIDADYRKLVAKNTVSAITEGGNTSSYNYATRIINYRSGVLSVPDERVQTTRHEVGHNIDHALGQNGVWLSLGGEMKAALDLDRLTALADAQAITTLLQSPQHGEKAGISDIMEGLTNGSARGYYGHGLKYWTVSGRLEKEAFANLFEVFGGNDQDQIQLLEKLLPNTTAAFRNLIKGVI